MIRTPRRFSGFVRTFQFREPSEVVQNLSGLRSDMPRRGVSTNHWTDSDLVGAGGSPVSSSLVTLQWHLCSRLGRCLRERFGLPDDAPSQHLFRCLSLQQPKCEPSIPKDRIVLVGHRCFRVLDRRGEGSLRPDPDCQSRDVPSPGNTRYRMGEAFDGSPSESLILENCAIARST